MECNVLSSVYMCNFLTKQIDICRHLQRNGTENRSFKRRLWKCFHISWMINKFVYR